MSDLVEIPWSGCHIWLGATDTSGYPCRYSKLKGTYYPHRELFKEVYGELEDGHIVRHKCDTPSCLNPEHLTLGTYSDNAKDRYKRGRSPTKLSFEDVRKIKLDTRVQRVIAEEYKVNQSLISRIKKGECWNYKKETPIGG